MNAPANPQLADLRRPQPAAVVPDTRVDMFSMQGFALAQRIASAFASSDAVPAQFRSHTLKKNPAGDVWVENPAAIGNCLVAIEVAQAVGMSIIAVMQNADIIEGKLRWTGKFVIAAINASRRFTPLRFSMRNLGPIKATYKEKTGWDKEVKRPIFTERTVEVDNEECICWALPANVPFPPGVHTLDQARAAGLPVVESAPVTMQMVVEEGWYAKTGSKWQTGMKALMFQYRAGSFFGNIHAPDIVMGMGRTAEEERDAIDLQAQPDGSYAPATMETLRAAPQQPAAVEQRQAETVPQQTRVDESAAVAAEVVQSDREAAPAAASDRAEPGPVSGESAPAQETRQRRAPRAGQQTFDVE